MSLEARFQLREKLGEGATSEVYDAYDRNLRRHVAIKLFRKFDRGGVFATMKERFLVDARAAAGVSHPNIVTIYDAGSFGEGIAIVMELTRDSLRKMLNRTPQLPLETVISIAAQVADGLACGIISFYLPPAPTTYPDLVDEFVAYLLETAPALVKSRVSYGQSTGGGKPDYFYVINPEESTQGALSAEVKNAQKHDNVQICRISVPEHADVDGLLAAMAGFFAKKY